MFAGLTILTGSNSCPARMLTIGCSALGSVCSICVAEGVGRECDICVRAGNFPLPAWWSAGRAFIAELARPSVQIVPVAVNGVRWGVVALVEAALVDGRFPIIGAADPDRAIDLALARGAQLRPRAKLRRVSEDQWQLDAVQVLCRAAIGQAKRWKGAR